MSQSRIHKLGKEGEEEERRLWVQNLGGDPLPERMIRIAGLGGFVHRHVAGANHTATQPDEVNGSGILDHGESRSGCSQHGGKAESSREDVDRSSDEGAKGRKHALSLASGESAREDIEDAGAGGDGEQRSSCEEESQQMSVQHLTIVAVGSTGIEAGYETLWRKVSSGQLQSNAPTQ